MKRVSETLSSAITTVSTSTLESLLLALANRREAPSFTEVYQLLETYAGGSGNKVFRAAQRAVDRQWGASYADEVATQLASFSHASSSNAAEHDRISALLTHVEKGLPLQISSLPASSSLKRIFEVASRCAPTLKSLLLAFEVGQGPPTFNEVYQLLKMADAPVASFTQATTHNTSEQERIEALLVDLEQSLSVPVYTISTITTFRQIIDVIRTRLSDRTWIDGDFETARIIRLMDQTPTVRPEYGVVENKSMPLDLLPSLVVKEIAAYLTAERARDKKTVAISQVSRRFFHAVAHQHVLIDRSHHCVARGKKYYVEMLVNKCPELLRCKGRAVTYSGKPYINLTALQIALCEWDIAIHEGIGEMAEMLQSHFIKLENGAAECQRQIQELFPRGIKAYLAEQKSYNFDTLIAAFRKSSEDDIKALLDKKTNNSELEQAIAKFREEFTALSHSERVYNPQHILKLCEIYQQKFDTSGKWSEDHEYFAKYIFLDRVFGFVNQFVPASDATVLAVVDGESLLNLTHDIPREFMSYCYDSHHKRWQSSVKGYSTEWKQLYDAKTRFLIDFCEAYGPAVTNTSDHNHDDSQNNVTSSNSNS